MRERARNSIGMGLVAIALLLASCGVTSPDAGRVSARGGAPAAATPSKTMALAWRQVTFPSGFDLQSWRLAESPVDGRDLWLCAPTQGDDFTIWASRDAGVTWASVGRITAATPEPASCALVADQGSATSLAAVITWGSGEAGTLRSISELSADGGADWYALQGDMQLQVLATMKGRTYAILHDTANAATPGPGLVMSVDGLRTWQAINPPGKSAQDSIFQFWLGPSAGDLAAASIQDTLWHSENAGASWTQLPTPDAQTSLGAWLPQMGHWLFCSHPGTPPNMTLTCSGDQGKSWQQEPTFADTLQCASCGKGGAPYSDMQVCIPTAIATDGSLLAGCPLSGTDDVEGATQFALYRLAPNATAWTMLGAAPGGFTLLASGQLWSLDGQGGKLFVTTLPF